MASPTWLEAVRILTQQQEQQRRALEVQQRRHGEELVSLLRRVLQGQAVAAADGVDSVDNSEAKIQDKEAVSVTGGSDAESAPNEQADGSAVEKVAENQGRSEDDLKGFQGYPDEAPIDFDTKSKEPQQRGGGVSEGAVEGDGDRGPLGEVLSADAAGGGRAAQSSGDEPKFQDKEASKIQDKEGTDVEASGPSHTVKPNIQDKKDAAHQRDEARPAAARVGSSRLRWADADEEVEHYFIGDPGGDYDGGPEDKEKEALEPAHSKVGFDGALQAFVSAMESSDWRGALAALPSVMAWDARGGETAQEHEDSCFRCSVNRVVGGWQALCRLRDGTEYAGEVCSTAEDAEEAALEEAAMAWLRRVCSASSEAARRTAAKAEEELTETPTQRRRLRRRARRE
jgi:hypothetical protein